MIAKRIAGATHNLSAPDGWDATKHGMCGHLCVRAKGVDPRGGDGYCESAWEPTPRELQALNAGGQVILRVYGWQPAVSIYVERPGSNPVVERKEHG